MRHFDEIWKISAERKGGDAALEALIEKPKPRDEVLAVSDDRVLSLFSSHIFATGLAWSVVEKKWEGIEAAFHQFDLGWCSAIEDERLDKLMGDTRIIRSGPKVVSVRDNAIWLSELAREHGSAAKFFLDWPSDDFAGLLQEMKDKGSRLGGSVGAYGLRRMGIDSYFLSNDVTARLIAEGVVDKKPTSKSAMRNVQAAFNTWREQSGRSLTEISRVLAMSTG